MADWRELLAIAGQASTDEQRRRFARELEADMRGRRGARAAVEEEDEDLAAYLREINDVHGANG